MKFVFKYDDAPSKVIPVDFYVMMDDIHWQSTAVSSFDGASPCGADIFVVPCKLLQKIAKVHWISMNSVDDIQCILDAPNVVI